MRERERERESEGERERERARERESKREMEGERETWRSTVHTVFFEVPMVLPAVARGAPTKTPGVSFLWPQPGTLLDCAPRHFHLRKV